MATGTEERKYRIEFTSPATKQFRDLPSKVQDRISPHIDALAANPRPHGALKIKGEDDQYRIRVGSYRVVYSIVDERLIVSIVRVADRKDVYRS